MKTRTAINCNTCLKRPWCEELCNKAKKYVDQDYVPQKEKVLGKPVAFGRFEDLTEFSHPGDVILTPRQISILVLVSAGVPKKTICKALRLKGTAFNEVIHLIRKKYREKKL